MAYDFVAASSQYIEGGAAAVTDEPVTFSALVYPKSPNANGIVMSIGTASATDRLQVNHNANVQAWTVTTSTSDSAVSASNYTNDVWSQFGGVFLSDTSRRAFLNGVGGTVNTGNIAIAETLARTVIGARMTSGSYGTFASARIAEVAVWNVALTDAEMASLAKGFKPTRIRPQNLKFYAPLLRNLQDLQTAMSLTNNNSATVANHPRVY